MVIKKPKSSEICPPGYHIVRGHQRICHLGTKTWVDTHLRKNRGKLDMFRKENLLYVYWNSKRKYSKLKSIKGFKQDDGALDEPIQFWLEYWRKQGLQFPNIDALLIKTLIAIESSFSLKADPKIKNSSAYGLMQITDQTRRLLNGTPNKEGYREVRSEYITLSKEDLEDPMVSVAAGIRWLSHKYNALPKKAEKNLFNTIKYYHSWDKEGDKYAKEVLDLYEKSK